MKLIFVRHGEPDYKHDALTEKGRKEAELCARRIKEWDVTQFYVSPLGRARETASYTLRETGREAIELPYMREFYYPVVNKVTGHRGVPWDFIPSDWTADPHLFELEGGFLEFPCLTENPDIRNAYQDVISNFDSLLEGYGYVRDHRFYRNINLKEKRHVEATTAESNKILNAGEAHEPVLVFFCHLGVTCIVLSHLLNIPFETLTHGFFMPPTSLTIVTTEERWDNEAYFRVQALGDCTHLLTADHPISSSGLFGKCFQG